MKEEESQERFPFKVEAPLKKPVGRPSILARSPRDPLELEVLMASRQKLEVFIEELGELRNTEVPEEVASYF